MRIVSFTLFFLLQNILLNAQTHYVTLKDTAVYYKTNLNLYSILTGVTYVLSDSLPNGNWVLEDTVRNAGRKIVLCTGSYQDGIKQGLFCFDNGYSKAQIPYKSGVIDGRVWQKNNNQLVVEAWFKDGKPHGNVNFYFKDALESSAIYFEGSLLSIITYLDSIICKFEYWNHILDHYILEEYSQQGQLVLKAEFLKGELILYEKFYNNGILKEKVRGIFVSASAKVVRDLTERYNYSIDDLISGQGFFYQKDGSLIRAITK